MKRRHSSAGQHVAKAQSLGYVMLGLVVVAVARGTALVQQDSVGHLRPKLHCVELLDIHTFFPDGRTKLSEL